MFKKLSFRKKIFFSQLILFILFIAILYPLIGKTVHQIMRSSLEKTTSDLTKKLKKASSVEEMIQILKAQRELIFYRIALLDDKQQILYDSNLVPHPKDEFVPLPPGAYPEVEQALQKGLGYSEHYSPKAKHQFFYMASAFVFQEKTYVIRVAFSATQVDALSYNFEIGFVVIGGSILLFFMLMTGLIFFRTSLPIQHIINAIKPYQKGEAQLLPHITLEKNLASDDEFTRLADTLNSLSDRVESQIKDITKERNEKEAILESLAEGVIAVDSNNIVTHVNYTGSKMLQIPKINLLGKPFPKAYEKISVPLLLKSKNLLDQCQEDQKILTDSLLIHEPVKLYLDLIAAPKTKNQGAILVIQDKSSQHRILEMGKEFISNASHELRTPITIIKGFAETLQDMPELPREMVSDMVEKIVRNCQRMESLVKNLLTLADIDNIPETHFQPADLVLLLDNCKHLLLMVHPDVLLSFEKSGDKIVVPADPDLLELAFINILENAVKYSVPPAQIFIRIKEFKEEVVIEIEDKGIGIPPEDVEHIFERFFTVDKARSRRLGGAGLGLSIVRTIIQKHFGTIKATSSPKVGTTFTITLPRFRS